MFKTEELLKATGGKLLQRGNGLDFSGLAIDSRAANKSGVFLAIKGKNFDGHDYIRAAVNKGARCVVSQRPIPKNLPKGVCFIKVKDTVLALGDIARYHRSRFDIPVIAVTGSNGKTTTKEMIAWVLSKRFKVLKNEGTKNNNIGLPLTLLKLDKSFDIVVVEIGTNHFGEVGYLGGVARPNIAVITNIGPSHLEFFKDLSGVFKEKISLLDHLQQPAIAVLNCDDRYLNGELRKKNRQGLSAGAGLEKPGDFTAKVVRCGLGGMRFRVNSSGDFFLNTWGYHNIYNALLAVSAGRILGLDYRECSRRLKSFVFPQGRFRSFKLNEAIFIDDTYNSNPLSLKHALRALENIKDPGRKILVMGDMLELGKLGARYHRQAGSDAARVCDILITVGQLSRNAARAASNGKGRIKMVLSCDTSLQARDILLKRVLPGKGDVVLVKGSRSMKMEEVLKR